jgi:hypothetical protein
MLQEFSFLVISFVLYTAGGFTSPKNQMSRPSFLFAETGLQAARDYDAEDAMAGPFFFSGEPKVDDKVLKRLETIFREPSSYVSVPPTTATTHIDFPFYFSRRNESSED